MEELFSNIPDKVRQDAELIYNMIKNIKNPLQAVKILNDFTNLFSDEEARDFLRFYFNMRMEQDK